ncbi:MAG: 2-oxo acid dehydrogenase subunit E2 [Microbacteriaceae bacterium]|nr:2-oxo acid dehydrogenase subunit E2 [Microbacteriaceae bacterium]
MSQSVALPALGESVTEGTVTRWLKQVGDAVAVDEPLLEVSTDKVDTEIPSPVAGTVQEILVQEDETVEVGTALVIIAEAGEEAAPAPAPAAESPALVAETPAPAAPAPVAEAPTPVVESPAPVVESPAPVAPAPVVETPVAEAPASPVSDSVASTADVSYITPIVRKLANDHGVNLDALQGSGVGGRIRKEDVLAAASGPSASSGNTVAAKPAPVAVVSPLRGTTTTMSRLRKVISQRAVASLQASAQLTTVVEADVTAVANLRDKVKNEFLQKTGNKLSFLPFFALAAAEALQQYPIINAYVDGENIVYPETENISIAVDTERGLLTPVLKDAGKLNIAEIAAQIADLAERTRNNTLKPDELSGGTFTLTNTGSRGALFDTPLVFLPQSAILGTGVVSKVPAVVEVDGNAAIAIRSKVYLALSYDHRIIDGADAARFLGAIKSRLEDANFASNLGI